MSELLNPEEVQALVHRIERDEPPGTRHYISAVAKIKRAALEHAPIGECACGCGERTEPAKETRRGRIKGQPNRFVRGHHSRKTTPEFTEDGAGCWVWQRSRNDQGYGQMWNGSHLVYAHRLYYEQAYGPIPEGLDLDHLCRVRHCVNPDHLEPVTRAENARRGDMAILTADDARAIYAARGRITARELAKTYGIAKGTVSNIWTLRSWRDAIVCRDCDQDPCVCEELDRYRDDLPL